MSSSSLHWPFVCTAVPYISSSSSFCSSSFFVLPWLGFLLSIFVPRQHHRQLWSFSSLSPNHSSGTPNHPMLIWFVTSFHLYVIILSHSWPIMIVAKSEYVSSRWAISSSLLSPPSSFVVVIIIIIVYHHHLQRAVCSRRCPIRSGAEDKAMYDSISMTKNRCHDFIK